MSHHLLREGEAWQLREYLAHRSIYHLKEADPQAWVIPRLPPAAKAALVTVEHDEYGAGDPERVHAQLFAAMLRCTGLNDGYGAYLDLAPAPTLAEVNLMSLCGLHRALRGALVGQFATVELTSSPGSDRLVRAMDRMGFTPQASAFYAEHVEADAVHEQLMRRGVLQPLLADGARTRTGCGVRHPGQHAAGRPVREPAAERLVGRPQLATAPPAAGLTASGHGQQIRVQAQRPEALLAAVDGPDTGRAADLLPATGITVTVHGPAGPLAPWAPGPPTVSAARVTGSPPGGAGSAGRAAAGVGEHTGADGCVRGARCADGARHDSAAAGTLPPCCCAPTAPPATPRSSAVISSARSTMPPSRRSACTCRPGTACCSTPMDSPKPGATVRPAATARTHSSTSLRSSRQAAHPTASPR